MKHLTENFFLEKIDNIIKCQEKTNNLLEQIIKIFSKYDEGYSEMIEKDRMIKKPT